MVNSEKIYIDFASKISFFEFIQEEFRNSKLDIKSLDKEFKVLKNEKNWNINKLSDYIKQYPKSFLIFQEVVQLLRFTNAQLIHFIFDVEKLNCINLEAIFEYLIFNAKYDENLRKLFLNTIDKKLSYEVFIKDINNYDKKYLIAVFKQSVSRYIDKISKTFSILEKRIAKNEFTDFSIRFANYLLNSYRLNEVLESINIESFLKNKKIPIDTKSIHGNYAKIKILRVLEKNGFINIDNILQKNNISVLKYKIKEPLDTNLQDKKIFCTEKYVENIIKPNDKKLKKFDLIVFSNLHPKFLFEINFYSTEGTKIGINQNEYIELHKYIEQNFDNFEFCWITDGNYWLTNQGKNRFLNLLNHFKTIYNINLFAENIDSFK
ncbi:MAG: hypothetical protein COS68_01945 [Elusimicrobia bacterium CG06_land_8_20_14_3_00_38_11]|nr:MAG: hypothetical protein COS68_01945 [Elusimicrobia bacterium CG06_land_8_20_14_3_00_38_11]